MQERVDIRQPGSLVWAKIVGYPWWPAKIVLDGSVLLQNKVKVMFFGDNSQYCTPIAYLASDKLYSYTEKYEEFAAKAGANKKLRSSIAEAETYRNQMTAGSADNVLVGNPLEKASISECSYTKAQTASEMQTEEITPIVPEPDKMESLQDTINMQMKAPLKQTEGHNVSASQLAKLEVGVHNVVELLEAGIHKKLQKVQGSYQKRIHHQLKRKLLVNLLKKYNLHQQQRPQKPENSFKLKRPAKMIKKVPRAEKQHEKPTKDITNLAVLKLYQALKNQGFSIPKARQLSLSMVNRVLQGSKDNFRTPFIKLLSWVYKHSIEDIENQYIGFVQNYIGKDEAFSTETMASACGAQLIAH